jgi:hypothetical protein
MIQSLDQLSNSVQDYQKIFGRKATSRLRRMTAKSYLKIYTLEIFLHGHVAFLSNIFYFSASTFWFSQTEPDKGMSSFIFRLGSVVFNFTYIGDTLQKKERGCRGVRHFIGCYSTAAQSSMTTAFADLKYVQISALNAEIDGSDVLGLSNLLYVILRLQFRYLLC